MNNQSNINTGALLQYLQNRIGELELSNGATQVQLNTVIGELQKYKEKYGDLVEDTNNKKDGE